ncbi:hypothetical protein [Streptomyces odontomachi]|uniref:hypothetical protein n=1 Tax=Streptomyces odontomachi TaxID=2944940 RepID=UPI002109637F|nr:hypothetical protein [Streptomyces sp. ODS25]
MSCQTPLSGLALVLVVVGLLVALTGLAGAVATGHGLWRWVLAIGCTTQTIGWRLHTYRERVC